MMDLLEWLAAWSIKIWPWVGDHLAYATIFGALMWLLAGFLRGRASRLRYNIMLAASLKFAVPSILLLFLLEPLGVNWSLLAITPGNSPVMSAQEDRRNPLPLENTRVEGPSVAQEAPRSAVYHAMTAIWLGGFTILLIRWARRRRRFALLIAQSELCSGEREGAVLERVKRLMGVSRQVTLRLTRERIEPCAWGTWRTVILFPRELVEHLSEAELETVLMHEMAHIARWDNFAGNLHLALGCIFWFHPIVWLINRRLLLEREQACDEMVLQASGANQLYATTILKICRFCVEWRTVGANGLTGSSLKRRIRRIMDQNTKNRIPTPRYMVAAIVSAIILLWGGTELLNPGSAVAQYINEQAASVQRATEVQVNVPQGAPVLLKRVEARPGPRDVAGVVSDVRLSGVIENITNNPVIEIAFGVSHPRLEYQYYLETNAHIVSKGSFTGDLGTLKDMQGELASLRLEIQGVKFADHSIWGRFNHGLLGSGARTGAGSPIKGGPSGGVSATVSGGKRGGPKDGVAAGAISGIDGGVAAGAPPSGVSGGVAASDISVSISSEGKVQRYQGDSISQRAVKRAQPVFSRNVVQTSSKDSIVVEILVDPDGRVESARVVSGKPFGFSDRHNAALERDALEAARQWRFQTPIGKDTPVRMFGNLFFRVP